MPSGSRDGWRDSRKPREVLSYLKELSKYARTARVRANEIVHPEPALIFELAPFDAGWGTLVFGNHQQQIQNTVENVGIQV